MSDEPTEVAVGDTSASLLGSCEDRSDELADFAFWASNEAIEGLTRYDEDQDNELAVRYFGQNYDHDRVRARLLRLGQLARSPRLKFECLDESAQECADPNKVLYTWDTEWMKTDGWSIYVCGDRFWNERYVNGQDGGSDASQVGIMVHEISHLTGAISDAFTLNESALVDAALDPTGSFLMPDVAEAYRFYVMKTQF
jgi:hypothetical protein